MISLVTKETAIQCLMLHGVVMVLADFAFAIIFVFGFMFANDTHGTAVRDIELLGLYPAILTLAMPWAAGAYLLKDYSHAGWVSVCATGSFVPLMAYCKLLM